MPEVDKWAFTDDLTHCSPNTVTPTGVLRVATCEPLLLIKVMLVDVRGIIKAEFFDSSFHPNINCYKNRKSLWSKIDGGTMLMNPYSSHFRTHNGVTHGSLIFMNSNILHAFVTILEPYLVNDGNKTPRSPSKYESINYHKDTIPCFFLNTGDVYQQPPHLNYHRKEFASFQGTSEDDVRIKLWNVDVPLSHGGLHLAIYVSVQAHNHWSSNGKHNQFMNPSYVISVSPGHFLLFRWVLAHPVIVQLDTQA